MSPTVSLLLTTDTTKQEMVGFGDGSGISWTTRKQFATHSRQITTEGIIINYDPITKCLEV